MWEPKSNLLKSVNNEFPATLRMSDVWEQISNSQKIVTSRDFPDAAIAVAKDDLSEGFRQFQIPYLTDEKSPLFMTFAEPNSEFPEHAHSDAAVFRIIASGSVRYRETVLESGDWMFVPAGLAYSLTSGAEGATLLHGYQRRPK